MRLFRNTCNSCRWFSGPKGRDPLCVLSPFPSENQKRLNLGNMGQCPEWDAKVPRNAEVGRTDEGGSAQ